MIDQQCRDSALASTRWRHILASKRASRADIFALSRCKCRRFTPRMPSRWPEAVSSFRAYSHRRFSAHYASSISRRYVRCHLVATQDANDISGKKPAYIFATPFSATHIRRQRPEQERSLSFFPPTSSISMNRRRHRWAALGQDEVAARRAVDLGTRIVRQSRAARRRRRRRRPGASPRRDIRAKLAAPAPPIFWSAFQLRQQVR